MDIDAINATPSSNGETANSASSGQPISETPGTPSPARGLTHTDTLLNDIEVDELPVAINNDSASQSALTAFMVAKQGQPFTQEDMAVVGALTTHMRAEVNRSPPRSTPHSSRLGGNGFFPALTPPVSGRNSPSSHMVGYIGPGHSTRPLYATPSSRRLAPSATITEIEDTPSRTNNTAAPLIGSSNGIVANPSAGSDGSGLSPKAKGKKRARSVDLEENQDQPVASSSTSVQRDTATSINASDATTQGSAAKTPRREGASDVSADAHPPATPSEATYRPSWLGWLGANFTPTQTPGSTSLSPEVGTKRPATDIPRVGEEQPGWLKRMKRTNGTAGASPAASARASSSSNPTASSSSQRHVSFAPTPPRSNSPTSSTASGPAVPQANTHTIWDATRGFVREEFPTDYPEHGPSYRVVSDVITGWTSRRVELDAGLPNNGTINPYQMHTPSARNVPAAGSPFRSPTSVMSLSNIRTVRPLPKRGAGERLAQHREEARSMASEITLDEDRVRRMPFQGDDDADNSMQRSRDVEMTDTPTATRGRQAATSARASTSNSTSAQAPITNVSGTSRPSNSVVETTARTMPGEFNTGLTTATTASNSAAAPVAFQAVAPPPLEHRPMPPPTSIKPSSSLDNIESPSATLTLRAISKSMPHAVFAPSPLRRSVTPEDDDDDDEQVETPILGSQEHKAEPVVQVIEDNHEPAEASGSDEPRALYYSARDQALVAPPETRPTFPGTFHMPGWYYDEPEDSEETKRAKAKALLMPIPKFTIRWPRLP